MATQLTITKGAVSDVAVTVNETEVLVSSQQNILVEVTPAPRQEINIDKGEIGPQGPQGDAATIAVGTTTTGAAGTSASVVNSGTSSDAVFNFTIPRGNQGAQGDTGPQGPKGDTGDTGAGVATGGTTGQVLVKASNTNYDTAWATITGTLSYQGSWNALTNTPALTSSVGTNGYYYVVSVAGSTNLNGITDWQVGDWAIFNGSIWQKIDQTNTVTSVNGQTGAVSLGYADLAGAIPTWNQNTTGTAANVTGVVAVVNGGTGASTASGARTNLGLGTIATQNANAVAITGGAIDGTTIGASTASTGRFSDLTDTGLTAGRVTYAGTGGNLVDSANLTFNGTSLTATNIDNTAIGATTPAAGTFTTLTATGQTDLGGPVSTPVFRVNPSTPTQYLDVFGGTTGTTLIRSWSTNGSSSGLNFQTRGASGFSFQTAGSSGNEQMRIANTASAVNYVQVTGAATGGFASISTQGSDASVGLNIISKGALGTTFATNGSSTNIQFRVLHAASAVNRVDAVGSATGIAPVVSVSGTDTNISQVFQSKGTGAIDLAAGSSGVNISNGGTVTAITGTAGGSYTTVPTFTISAPTTAGGVQATGTAAMAQLTMAVAGGGTGYTVNDVLTFVGGTGTAMIVTVTTVSSGVITGFTVTNGGTYTVLPTNPISVTGGTGSGATFNVTAWQVRLTAFTITAAGSGYVEQPTITFSSGSAAAYATVGSIPTLKTVGSAISFATPGGEQVRVIDTAGAVNWLELTGSSGNIVVATNGSGSPAMIFRSKGSGTNAYSFGTANSATNVQMQIASTASAVNYVQVTGAATGGRVTISAQGSDANVPVVIGTKGSGSLNVRTNDSATTQFAVTSTASAVNYINVTGAVTGSDPIVQALGSDTNIDLVLSPKGTGALQAQQTDSTATGGNARGANAVDWQTVRVSAGAVASAFGSVLAGGYSNTASGSQATVSGGSQNAAQGINSFAGGGALNTIQSNGYSSVLVGGYQNTVAGYFNFVGAGTLNSGTSGSAATTQSATMNGTTAVTLSGSNANIKVGQIVTGTSIAFPNTYVAAISGTSLTLSQAASGSSTSTLSFFTPHGVVVGGGNNQATGSYSFIGGGGDAGTASGRNIASGDWSFVGGGFKNQATNGYAVVCGGSNNQSTGPLSFVGSGDGNVSSGQRSVVTGGLNNTANADYSTVVGGIYGTTRSISGATVFTSGYSPITLAAGASQSRILVLGRQTTDATATVLATDINTAGTGNQVILPNNSAYFFRGTVVAGVTGGGNTKGWTVEGVIKRGANAASTALVGTPTVTSSYADAGASTWALTATADTTNGGLAITFTGQAATTIRCVAKIETTEMTY
jgi:hypothetical protein